MKSGSSSRARWVVLALAAIVGCDGGSNGGDPTAKLELEIRSPESDMQVEPGMVVSIEYRGSAEGESTADIYADRDGDLETTDDQVAIERGVPVDNGAVRVVSWDTSEVPAGRYSIVAMMTEAGSGETVTALGPGEVTVEESTIDLVHRRIVLRDRLGQAITAESTEPYSPRATCGRCHNVDKIANGYHFQQGRTDTNGRIVMKDDFFADGRQWLKSAGMYGKW